MRYRAMLLAGTALVTPLALAATHQPAMAQVIGGNGGNGRDAPNGYTAGGGGGGGGYGDGSATAPGGGGGGTGGSGNRGGVGGGSDGAGSGGIGYVAGAGGGGGGAGGAGLTLGADLNNSSAITGGKGGYGGIGNYNSVPSNSYGGGGGGGGGGSGIIATTGANLINSGTITGGTGGGGGSSSGAINPFTDPSGNGTGGRGGNGITATGSAGLTITNTGTIKGGGGGTDFQNYQPYRPQAGGFGIIGQNLTIINSGTIAGGALGGGGGLNGAPSTAIIITGGTNSIKALAGSNIGAIELGGVTTLAGTFNNTIQVDGGVTVSVTGSTGADDATGITTFNNFGTTVIGNARTLSAQTINNGAGMINIGAGATLRGTGNTLNNNTVINVGAYGSIIDAGAVNNQGGGTINFNGPTGTATLSSGINSIVNDGRINVLGGAVAVTGDISNQNGGTLSLTGGDMTGIGTLTNSGTATVNVAAGYNLGVDTFAFTAGNVTGTGTITATTAFNLSSGTIGAALAGAGVLTKTGTGTTVLTGANTYSGGTNINGGTLSVSADANLGSGALSFNGGTLLATTGFAASHDATLNAGGGTLSALAGNTLTYNGVLSGTGGLTKAGAGTVALAGANTYSGATTISNGTLQVGDGATAGKLGDGDVANSGKLDFNRIDTVSVGNKISGSGALGQSGTGTTILTGASDYTGATTVSAGKLIVNGSIASSAGVTVDAGAVIGGSGTIASTIVNGTLAAGNSPGTLTVAGDLTLNAGSTSLFELGTPGVVGGLTNDLVIVNGNLALGGTLEAPSAVTGYYRLFNVSGTTTGSFDAVPTDAIVSTAVANQVNLLQRNGGQLLQFWDGTDVAGNGGVDGGAGNWSAANSNWTGAPGEAGINDSWRGEVGVFAGTAGTVTVSGAIGFQGLQFSTDGYELSGGTLDLSGDAHGNAGASFITTDAGVTATVSSVLTSTGMIGLDKLGSGTLVLTGENTYSGLTTISAGTLQLGNGSTSGSVAGDIVNQGVLAFNRTDSNLTLGGAISGAGRVEQNGTGTTILAGANTYTGGTRINAGTLQVGDGASSGSIAGNIVNNSALVFNRSDMYGSFSGDISGSGTLTVTGGGTLATSGDLGHTGGTTIDSGSVLVVGDGATHGSLAGNVANAGSLAFDRSDDTAFAGNISGSGTFHKYGAGVLTLSGDNSAYDGIVNVQAGTLRVANSSAIGTGYLMMYSGALDYGANVDLANIMLLQQDNTELWVKQGSARQAGIILTGGGVPHAVEKKGDGVLVVDRMNHGGATTVSEGTLRAGGQGAFDSRSAVAVASGAKLDLAGFNQTIASLAGAGDVVLGAGRLTTGDASSTAFSGGISGTGSLAKSGSGTFTLSGTNSYAGGTTISAGTLAGSASSFGSGAILDDAALIIDQAADATFANAINGTGSFTKKGAGRLNLTGTSLLSGETTVSAGRLSVNGSLANSAVTLQSGASLGGIGTVGKVTALSGSTVGPGNSIGTLNVAGDMSFAAGSIYQVEADATGESDRLAVSGKVTLSGGTVQVLAATGDYTTAPQYTILTAASGVVGQFSSVTSNLAFLTPTLSYTANAISLSLARNDISFASIGRTRNQIAAAGGAEQLGTGNAIYKAVARLDKDTARKAFDLLSGEVHASVNGMLVEDSSFLADAANARIRAAFGEAGATSVPVMAYGPGGPLLAEAATDRLAVWSQAYGSWGDTDSDGNAAAFSRSTGGFVAGADAPIGDNWRLGVIGGYSQTSFDATDRASSGSSSNYHAGLFGGGRWGAFSLRAGAAYSWHDIETSRDVAFQGFSDSLAAKYHAGTAQVFGELGYSLNVGGVSLEPFGGLAHVHVKADGFSEQGGKAALTSAGSTTETTFTTVGLRAGADFTVRDISATVRGMVGWRHAFGDTTPLSSLAFAGGGAFTVAGVPIAKDSAIVEAGLDFAFTPSATLGVSYTSQFGGAAIDQSFKANLGVRF